MVVEATGFEAGEPATAFICQASTEAEAGRTENQPWWGTTEPQAAASTAGPTLRCHK